MFASHHKQEHSARKKMLSGLYAKSYLHKSEPLQAQATQILFGRLLPLLEDTASTKSVRQNHVSRFILPLTFFSLLMFMNFGLVLPWTSSMHTYSVSRVVATSCRMSHIVSTGLTSTTHVKRILSSGKNFQGSLRLSITN